MLPMTLRRRLAKMRRESQLRKVNQGRAAVFRMSKPGILVLVSLQHLRSSAGFHACDLDGHVPQGVTGLPFVSRSKVFVGRSRLIAAVIIDGF